MPFKFKLKKSRQYNVSSKNLFVLSVELLDNTTVECTLSSQSLGQECLDNVCQRLGLQQPQYFGLRFLSKKGTFWWVDLQKPLKKQLDKYAFESYSLYLGVMFFVSDVNMLHDEVTRYHYFLQLKSDILEGKLHCDEDQTILFASYSLQAEFGDHDPERHTTEYLTNFGLLPKQMALAKENQEAILERVILNHRNLQGMSQQLAEIYYIMEAQHLSGYSLECFAAKDSTGTAVIIGVSLAGIYIWYMNNQPSAYFPWDKILNLVHHKKSIGIDSQSSSKIFQLYLEDSHLAKYVWKICIQQHSFYTKNESTVRSVAPVSPKVPVNNVSQLYSKSAYTLQESQESLDRLDVYHTDNGYKEGVPSSVSCNAITEIKIKAEGKKSSSLSNLPSHLILPQENSTCLNTSTSCTATAATSALPSSYSQPLPQSMRIARESISSLRRMSSDASSETQGCKVIQSSTSVASVSRGSQSSSHDIANMLESQTVGSLLPTYRQAPDYDTAVKMKYDQQRNEEHVSALSLHPPIHTYSSPDLSSQSTNNDMCTEPKIRKHLMYHLKPPPPYPFKQKSSSSTPDLSSHHQVSQICSSPRLILQRNFEQNLNHLLSSHNHILPHTAQYHHQENLTGNNSPSYEASVKMLTLNAVPHQTVITSHKSHSQANHIYQNYNLNTHLADSRRFVKPLEQSFPARATHFDCNNISLKNAQIKNIPSWCSTSNQETHTVGPMFLAAMNGLSLSGPDILSNVERQINDGTHIQVLESKLAEGQVFLEFESIIKKKPNADFTTAMLPENVSRNRFKDVFPYEDNRVRLTPTSENQTGYINASHISITLGSTQRFYIATQGPLPNTLYSFWQMIWEYHVSVIVMLNEVQEQGRDKCFLYWPQEDGSKIQIGEFQIIRNFSMSSSTYVTSSLLLCHITSEQQRCIWHIQYTDWPDHSCPQDAQGFIAFMNEVDAVRRHSIETLDPRLSSSSPPIVVHCSAGVGRTGAVILCDIMLHCVDHNQPIDVPQVLTHLRLQRMLIVQTLAQYKFVYKVLIEYLKNSRLI